MTSAEKNEKLWQAPKKEMTKEAIKRAFGASLRYGLAKDRYTRTSRDDFFALAMLIRDRLVERWIKTQQNYHKQNEKRVYYLSLEFLIGRLLGSYMMNLDIEPTVKAALDDFGIDLDKIFDQEMDAGLGNGGLGRLAACFLDSMATLGIPAHGYGIRYDYGMFNQKIMNGYQVEAPDEWLKLGNPWEFHRPEYAVKIKFYGRIYTYTTPEGELKVEWRDAQEVIAMPYDTPVPGYKNNVVNTLRLWSARGSEEFDLEYFNNGDYENAVYNKMFSENISRVLYPNDASAHGRELRLKQEYFFTAASIADIIRRYKADNQDIRRFSEKVVIQLNDTHPALAVVELMRVLLDQEGLDWETAWDIVVKTFAYTNHTLMPEALETWAVARLEKVLPRHMQLIYEINARFLREVSNRFPGDVDRLRRMSIIVEGEQKRVRMAYLAIIGSHSVNGVSELHSSLIQKNLFHDFAEFNPEKFNNKTNGVTPRNWLFKSNPKLTDAISRKVGCGWLRRFDGLRHLAEYAADKTFQNEWKSIKRGNKLLLADYIQRTTDFIVNTDALFDVQVKRIHEYKRQVLFGMYMISEYLKIKNNPKQFVTPRTFIVGGKAAPGYRMAKNIIKFINSIADVINHDKSCKDKLQVVFIENYRVSVAEKIFPASDLSEQISTAGMEASGTGCMKFMMNGALTIGTLDGANIEIAEALGREDIYIFGKTAEEVSNLRREGYDPLEFIKRSDSLQEILNMIRQNFFTPNDPGLLENLYQSLVKKDAFFVCADFESYCATQEKISKDFQRESLWIQKSIRNVAASYRFSSDRTIREYAKNIWKVPVSQ